MIVNTPEHDTELITRLAVGDEKALQELFNRYRNKIYAISLKITKSTVLAEEIVQDVFVKIWVNRERLPQLTFFNAYLFTIARNLCFNELKKLASLPTLVPGLPEDMNFPVRLPDSVLVEKEFMTIWNKAIERLPPQQRRIYEMAYHQNLTRQQIAELLALSPETVKNHLNQARRNIRAYCQAWLEASILILLTAGMQQP